MMQKQSCDYVIKVFALFTGLKSQSAFNKQAGTFSSMKRVENFLASENEII